MASKSTADDIDPERASPLLQLPAEIRLAIWGHLFQDPVHVKSKQQDKSINAYYFEREPYLVKTEIPRIAEELAARSTITPGLLSTCQKIASETLPTMENLPFVMALADFWQVITRLTRDEKRRIKHVWITIGPHDSSELHEALCYGLRYFFKLESITFLLPPPIVALKVAHPNTTHRYLVKKAQCYPRDAVYDNLQILGDRIIELTREEFHRLLQDPVIKAAFAKYPDFKLELDGQEDWRAHVYNLLEKHPEAKPLFGSDCEMFIFSRYLYKRGDVLDIAKELENLSHWLPNTCTWKVVDWNDVGKMWDWTQYGIARGQSLQ
ncbi:uncharacterized protein BDZ99DRAFT_503358 [Mytilinidion resinicola]|uniref:Uncharacterized protein n=1 Tax=Mytilinidion resinicola TaxID=574789 RepID=A0A6A6Y526_9PEZI|nr:uncharacterized protein BDZ99DRAFT_503358 [Mytilinidion resinicola]KAF2803335.1 hypothetical protein BDZ99DRAFT_503358 [Mytilinidion resinicola]